MLSVMAFHFGASWAPGGFLGVDMFFVLSGYLITSLLVIEWERTSTLHFAAFWARRARRLLPALFLLLIAISIWAAAQANRDQLDAIRWDSIWTLFYGANWRFISSGQSYFDMFRDPSPLRHAWSLAIEEQFYLVWPIVTFVSLRLARGRRWLLASACVVGIATSTVLMARLYQSANPSRAYYGTDTRAGQLLLGALLALVLLAWRPRRQGSQVALQGAGVVAAVFCAWAFATANDQQTWLYHGGFLLFAVATALVIAAVVQPSRSPLHSLLAFRPVRWVGAISYGLYLWHWPVTVAVSEGRTDLSGWRLAVVRVALTFAAATISYYVLELPIRRGVWLRGRVAQVFAPIAGLATALVIVSATTGGTAPPEFLVATPNSVLKHHAVPVSTTPTTLADNQPAVSRMLLIGDSVADTLSQPLQAVAAEHGVAFDSWARPGCGLLTDPPLRQDDTPVPWGGACAQSTPSYESDAVRTVTPDVVLWLSTWETTDILVNGDAVGFETRAGDAALLENLEAARTRIEAGGARLVLLTLPVPADTSEVKPLRADEGSRRLHLNTLFRAFAARHPADVAVADLASIVCPAGGTSCPASVDGVVLRPRDGNHFEGDGPAWVAPRLYSEIVRALGAMPQAVAQQVAAQQAASLAVAH